MALEIAALVVGLVIGALAVYAILYRRMFNMADGKARQLFETQRSDLELSIHETYGAKLEEWKATVLTERIT